MAQTPASFHPQPSALATQVAAALPVAPSAVQPLPRIITTSSQYLRFKKKHALFVDKTALLQELVELERVFVARPRRFGKTMLISMLTELFTNGTEQFEHLAIAERWDEPRCPVLQLSFRGLSYPYFEQELCKRLREACYALGFLKIYDFIPECQDFRTLVTRIEREVLQTQDCVLLIDEWDDPLSRNLHDREAFKANTEHMYNFYTWLREKESFHFVLVTGIGRYQNTSFFSGENITDISMDSNFAALVGYTEDEIRTYFDTYLARSAALCHQSEEAMLDQIRSYYDGFCFDEEGKVHVYSPWSVNCFFKQVAQHPDREPLLLPFWMDNSNAPSALRTYLQSHQPDLAFIDKIKAEGVVLSQRAIMSAYNFDTVPFVPLLVQTGYMTIKERLPFEGNVPELKYRCNFTNAEVENTFSKIILAYVTGQKVDKLEDSEVEAFAQGLLDSLQMHDVARAVRAINSLLVRVHYDLWQSQSREREAVYRALIALFLQIKLSSPYVRQEVANNVRQRRSLPGARTPQR